MKILHTSDWHLGRSLHGQPRHGEFAAFLDWLAALIEAEGVDVLLIAGDVFDSPVPGVRAQELYYRFLSRVSRGSCAHVVVTGGNHDSSAFLNAPASLLAAFNVHVVGACPENPGDEVRLLEVPGRRGGTPGVGASVKRLVVCAVPFIRDRDVRVAEAGESGEDKQARLVAGISAHYAEVCGLAGEMRRALGTGEAETPLVVMGHLFAAGGAVAEGDGVRDLYVGALGQVPATIFPAFADYVALGHLHAAQKVAGAEHIRYSGSPLAMGFGEAAQRKSVCLVSFAGREARPALVPVPVFQELARIQGDWETLADRITSLIRRDSEAWLEVVYTGAAVKGDLRESLEDLVAGASLRLLCVRNRMGMEAACAMGEAGETLSDLGVEAVFERCLDAHGVPESQRLSLREGYREILAVLEEKGEMQESGESPFPQARVSF